MVPTARDALPAAAVLAAIVVISVTASVLARAGPTRDPALEAPARVSGRVTARQTGDPIDGAALRLIPVGLPGPPRLTYTNEDGLFELLDVTPGTHILEAGADGYLTRRFGGDEGRGDYRVIVVSDDDSFTAADVALPAAGSMSGRVVTVVDKQDRPVPDVTVQLAEPRNIRNRMRLFASRDATVRTDDEGRFVITGLDAGEYYLTALTGAFGGPEGRSYALTHFPGTADAADAEPVALALSEEVTDLRLALLPAPMSPVGGRILDEQGLPVPRGSLLLMPSEAAPIGQPLLAVPVRGVSDGDGHFEFRDVPPGEYTIQAFGHSEEGGNLAWAPFASREVSVQGGEPIAVDLHVRSGSTLRGRIVFDGTSPRPDRSRMRVLPLGVDFTSSPAIGGPTPFEWSGDWMFEAGPMTGLRLVRVSTGSEDWVLKAVRLNGLDVSDEPFDFRNGMDVSGVEVVLTDRVATLTGTARDREGQPVRGYIVALFSSDPSRWEPPARDVYFIRPNQTGSFRATGLLPGEYLAVALAGLDEKRAGDPAYLAELSALATVVTLEAGDEKVITLDILR